MYKLNGNEPHSCTYQWLFAISSSVVKSEVKIQRYKALTDSINVKGSNIDVKNITMKS